MFISGDVGLVFGFVVDFEFIEITTIASVDRARTICTTEGEIVSRLVFKVEVRDRLS